MKVCLIAIKYENSYFSIKCRYSDPSHILELISTRFFGEYEALRFVSRGDVEFGAGSSARATQETTRKHTSPLALLSHAFEYGAESLYIFEDGSWHVVDLESEEILDEAV